MMIEYQSQKAWCLIRAADVGSKQTPILLDSPHSGTTLPPDFQTCLSAEDIQRTADPFVEQLWAQAPDQGASLLVADFPRSYIDPNRAEDDLDVRLLGEPWLRPVRPTSRSIAGYGLLWSRLPDGRALYDRPLTASEVQTRIDAYWRPYHFTLRTEMERLQQIFGSVWHLNCHSMPTACGAVEIVLGDRDGHSCAPAFTQFVKQHLEAAGYSVAINRPYKGAELVRVAGAPAKGRHSLQMEVRRDLYMDERAWELHSGFYRFKNDLSNLVKELGVWALAQSQGGSLQLAAE